MCQNTPPKALFIALEPPCQNSSHWGLNLKSLCFSTASFENFLVRLVAKSDAKVYTDCTMTPQFKLAMVFGCTMAIEDSYQSLT